MVDWRIKIGLLLGLAAFLVLAGLTSPFHSWSSHGALLPDCDGRIRELVIQYVPEAAPLVATTYREFLGQLPADITVYVLCPDPNAFLDLEQRLGRVSCRQVPVFTGHAMTPWSRDRWLAFAPRQEDGKALLLTPREEVAAGVWSQRLGDSLLGADLAGRFPAQLRSERSALAFDGGDFVADADTVFVTPSVLRRNEGIAVSSAAGLTQVLAAIFQRRVVLLPKAPPHHAGMFMMLAGNKTALVGDPSLVRRLWPIGQVLPLEEPDFSQETQDLFDAVAAEVRATGYRVVRIPIVPGSDHRTYLTYLNAIIDQRDGARIVYLPSYSGAGPLNDEAERIWKSLGCQVRRVDCSKPFTSFGSLRCLVNVIRRTV